MNLKRLRQQAAAQGWRSVAVRASVLSGGWWVIAEGDRSALLFGVPIVLLALGASVALPSPSAPRWSPTGLARFASAFLFGSLHGGLDVARRALAHRLLIAPTVLRYPLGLRTEPARHLFMGALSLMPGTLSVSLEGDGLEVHVLVDQGDGFARQLRDLEERVAGAAGERLEDRHA